MADNPVIDNGVLSDVTVAADDDGTAVVQWIKLKYGADGSFTAVDATNGLPVVGATGSAILGIAEDAALAGNTLRVGARAHTGLPTAVSADNDAVSILADRKGQQFVLPGKCATATLTSVADSASSQSLLASTATRMGAIFFNDSPSYLYLKYGATASVTSFTYKLDPGGTLEMAAPIYTGAIDGIWSANASGSVYITELST